MNRSFQVHLGSTNITILIALRGYRSKPSLEAALLTDLDIHLERLEYLI